VTHSATQALFLQQHSPAAQELSVHGASSVSPSCKCKTCQAKAEPLDAFKWHAEDEARRGGQDATDEAQHSTAQIVNPLRALQGDRSSWSLRSWRSRF
jgi:hypothetical protein